MKRSTKRDIAISCFVFALGCFLMAAGWGMGGSFTGGRNISIGGSNGVQIGGSGIFIGGSNGIYVGPYGISIGGRNGIYVGPGGIRIGASGAYNETVVDQVWIQSGTEGEWGSTVYEDRNMVVQNIEVEAFDRIEADINLGDISVIYDGNGYFVEFQDNIEGYELHYKFNGSTLVIWSEEQNKHWGNTINAKAQVTILVPVGTSLQKIDLATDLGDISVVGQDQTVSSATLVTDLGDINWYHAAAKELKAESSLGNVSVILPTGQGLSYDLSTNLGEVWLNGNDVGEKESHTARNEQYYVKAHSSLGDVELSFTESEE